MTGRSRRLAGAILGLLAGAVLASPIPRPASFYGTVTVGGTPVGPGIALTAEIGGVQYEATTTFEADGGTVYSIDVPADIPETPGVEGGVEGQTVEFLLDGVPVAETGTWSDGTYTNLNLSPPPGADLTIAKDDGVAEADPGDTLTYTLTITNLNAVDAFGVAVEDPLPVGTSFVSASDGGSEAAGIVVWPAFDLAAGASVTRTLVLQVNNTFPAGTGEIVNVATVASDGSDGFDPDPANNEAEDRDDLNGGPDLALVKTADLTEVRPGDTIVFTLEVTNNGFQDAEDVRLLDLLPPEVIFQSATGEGAILGGGVVQWPVFDVPLGATVTRTARVRVDPAVAPGISELVNTASVTDGNALELDPADNSTSLTLPILQAADLAVLLVDASGVVVDPQTLTIAGLVGVDLVNLGNADVTDPFDVSIFEDTNGNGTFEAGTDVVLGTVSHGGGLASGATLSVDLTVAGSVAFRNSPLYAFVDSAEVIAEHDEANNIDTAASACAATPTPGLFTPEIELAWPVAGTSEAFSRDSASVPLVVQLTDDNGDGVRDENDVPDIVFVSIDLSFPFNPAPRLRAIRGDTGAEIFSAPQISALWVFALTGAAAGDIDLDGRPEIIVSMISTQTPTGNTNRLAAYEHNGTFKWFSSIYNTHPNGTSLTNRDNPSMADLDRDGVPEIIVGANVFNNNGTLRWTGSAGQGYQSARNEDLNDSGAISIAADLDLTGGLELVTGNTAYNADGSIHWQIPFPDGYPSIGNFDADPFPEIVVVSRGDVRLHEHDGTLVWGPVPLPGDNPEAGGGATIGNFDLDSEPEIGVAGSTQYTVFEGDGTIKWQQTVQDGSSNMTGSTVFDFDGDGLAEVVYRDEVFLRIFKGDDGTVLYQEPVGSFTANEEAVVADVDRDGNAEIVISSNQSATRGLLVIGDAADNWVSARGVWNQHQYHIDNIADDGSIPQDEAPGWQTHNSYRANIAPAVGDPFVAPDVSASQILVDLALFPTVTVSVRIGNGGATTVGAGLPVAFYDGDPSAGGGLIGTAATTGPLAPGAFEDVSLVYALPGFGSFPVWVVADDDGAGQGRENECDEANNVLAGVASTEDLGLVLTNDDGIAALAAGDVTTYTLTITNANALDRNGVLVTDTLPANTLLVAASDGGSETGGVAAWPSFTLPAGAMAQRTLTVQLDPATPPGVTSITNTATVTDDGAIPDPTPANNTDTDVNQVVTVRADAGGPYGGDEGVPILFDGSGSSDSDGTIVLYEWDFDGDGTFDATGVTANQAFSADGVFTVLLKVTDDAGEMDTDTAEVTVANAPATVDPGPDQTMIEGDDASLTATTFVDGGVDDTHTATIDWGDGTVEPGTVTETGGSGSVAGSHLYADNGVFTVEICVTDDGGDTGCGSFAMTVDNADPVVLLATSPVDLSTWFAEDFGAGAPSNWVVAPDGASVTQTENVGPAVFYGDFVATGVTLEGSIRVNTSSDDDYIGFAIGFKPGDSTSSNGDWVLLDWKQNNQTISPGSCFGNVTGIRGLALSRVQGVPENATFFGHLAAPCEGGSVTELGRGATLTNTGWSDFTEYDLRIETTPTNIKVFVDGVLEIDVNGAFAFGSGRFGFFNYSQGNVTYRSVAQQGVAGLEGEPLALEIGFTDAGVEDTHTATIDWADGTVEPGTVDQQAGGGTVTGSHVYPDETNVDLEVCVTDDDGGTGCATLPATIVNAEPMVDAGRDRNSFIGEGLTLATPFTDPGVLDTHTATIDWGDGSVEAGVVNETGGAGTVAGQHVYAAEGVYTVEICVTDDDGGIGCDAFEARWITPVFDIAIGKTASLEAVRPGELLVYTLTVTNLGTREPENLVVTDALPDHLDVVGASGGGVFDAPSRTVTWVVPVLAYQSSVELRLVVTPQATAPVGATAVNTAILPIDGPFGPDENPADNSASASVVFSDADTPRVDLGADRTEVEGVAVDLVATFDDVLTTTGAATLPTAGLVGYWSFDELADPAFDSSTNVLPAVLGAAAGPDANDPAYRCASAVAPVAGNACGLDLTGRFDPADGDFATVANHPLLDFTAAYSISAWVREDNINDHRPFFVRGADDGATNANDIEIYKQSGSRDLVVVHNRDNGGTVDSVLFQDPPVNTLFHLAVTYDGTEIRVYYNGVEPVVTNNDRFLAAPLATGRNWLFGKVDHSAFTAGSTRFKFLDGMIDEVRFYDRALSVAEVAELAAVTGTPQAHTATVDWGDGTVEPATVGSGGTVTASHVYPDDFLGTIELCVTDDTSLTDCDSVAVAVENFVPLLAQESQSIDEGQTASLAAAFTDTGLLDTHTATIDWRDGPVEAGVVAFTPPDGTVSGSHPYLESGLYDAEVCVTDDDLGTGCGAFPIEVRNLAPVVTAGPDVTVDVGETFTINATFTDAGVLDTHTAPFFWGDGSSDQAAVTEAGGAGTAVASHAYSQPGTRLLSACVDDDDGDRGCDLVEVVVIGVPLPDLVVPSVDAGALAVDPQTLQTTGVVAATVRNDGDDVAVGDFTVTFFDDIDGDGVFGPGDPVLGQDVVTGLVAVDEERMVSATVDFIAAFAGDLVYAFADSGAAIGEADETNNVNQSGELCEFEPPVGTFNPVLEWSWQDTPVEPASTHVIVTPIIGDLNSDGIPDVLFSTRSDLSGNCDAPGFIRAISGDGGASLFDITDTSLRVDSCTPLAIADIDGDHLPEILAHRSSPNGIMAFEHNGDFKWFWAGTGSAMAIANIDAVGLPEILVGGKALNADGTLRWDSGVSVSGAVSVADLDLDGTQEIVGGSRALNHDGTVFYDNTTLPTFTFSAVGNFDADPNPEVVAVGSGTIWLLEHDGTVIWSITPSGLVSGGPPTIADYDGDGLPEVGVAGRTRYVAIDTDGTLLWAASTVDTSSRITGSSVFDFEGDGRSEVVYNDHNFLRVYDGATGAVLFQTSNSSCTSIEYPVVADVDADGNAEIVVARNRLCGLGNSSAGEGIFVFGDASDSWVATREVWNQHAYHVTNVEDDLTVPIDEQPSWLEPGPNSYRAQVLAVGNPLAAPDLTVSSLGVERTGCPAELAIVARVGNGGSNVATAPVDVAFYQGDPAASGVLLGTTQTSVDLEPGEFEDVILTLPPPVGGAPQVCVAVDEAGVVGECAEGNTLCADLVPGCATADLAVTKTDGLAVVVAGDPILYTVTVGNLGPDTAQADVSDLLPAAVLSPTWTCTATGGAGCTAGPVAGDLVDTASLPAGGIVTYLIAGTIDPAALGTLTNTALAVVGAPVIDPDPANDSATDTTEVVSPPELAASKSDALFADNDGDTVPSPGDEIEYTIVVSNSGGGAATGVTLTDLIPAHTQVVAGSVTTSQGTVVSEDPVEVDFGPMVGGGSTTMTFRVTVDNPVPAGVMDVVNQGVVTSNELPAVLTDDPDLGGAADPTETIIAAAPALVAEKTDALVVDADGDTAASPGDTLEYTLTLINNGNTSATAVALSDPIPLHTTVVPGSVTTTQGTIDGEDPVEVTVGEIAGGMATVTITFRVVVDNPVPAGVMEVVNQGAVTSAELPAVPTNDPDLGGDADPTVTMIAAEPDLVVEKVDALFADNDGDGLASPGDEVLYQLVIDNVGNTSATGVGLSDPVPAAAAVVAGSVQTSQGTVVSEDPVEVDLGEIAGGAGATVSFRVTIDDPFPPTATEIANQATVASVELPAVASDDPDTPAPDDPTATEVFVTPAISIGDVAATEADAAATGLAFPVTLSMAPNREVRVDYATADGTALAGADYQAAAATVVFAPGETTGTIVVAGLDDPLDEPDETFVVDLSSPIGATLADAQGGGTILDDDAPPALAIGDVVVTEGDAGATQAVFTVSLSAPSAFDVSVDYATADGSATAGADYTAAAGTLTIPAGSVSGAIPVDVLGDVLDEADETYTVDLSAPVNATLADARGLGTILDDDAPPALAIDDVVVTEGDAGATPAVFTVSLSAPSGLDVSVDYATADGTAIAGADYAAAAGTLTIPAGSVSGTIPVDVLGDVLDEADETYTVDLSAPVNATLADAQGLGTILDDDAPPALAIDDVVVTEGDAGATQAVFTVSLSAPSGLDVSVDYATADGTAIAGADYAAAAGTLTIPAGSASAAIPIDVLGDLLDELDETYVVDLTAPVNATLADAQGLGTILDDDESEISIADAAIEEGDIGTIDLVFTVSLSTPAATDLTFDYTTADKTALAGVDYETTTGNLTVPAGATTATIPVPVIGDLLLEPDETFIVELSNAIGGLLVDGEAVGTILDDELCLGPNLIANPGAEEPLAGGELPGWTEVVGTDWQPRLDNPLPDEGLAYFFAGATDLAELRQDVDISAYAAFIDGTGQAFLFDGLVRTFDEMPADTARVVVEYRDASNTVVLDVYDSGEITSPLAWQAVSDVRLAPAGTGWIRVRLVATRLSSGLDNDGYFDALSLSSLRTPVLTVSDTSVLEGDTGSVAASFTVMQNCAVADDVTITAATSDGTATAGADYLALAPTPIVIPAGTTSIDVSVDVFGDLTEEVDETFFLDLSDPIGAALLDARGLGTILDDDGVAFCPRSPGYWKNHIADWPVTTLELGGVIYGQSELLGFLQYGGSDASLKLARQLVATKLNLASGSDPQIQPVVDQADALLVVYPPGSRPEGAAKTLALDLKDQLDAYNSDPACDDEDSDCDSDSDDDSDCDSDSDSDGSRVGTRGRGTFGRF